MVSNEVPLQRRVSIGDHLHLILVRYLCWAPQRHLCRLASRPSSDLQIRQRRCRVELVYKSTFDVANRRSMEARGCGAIRLALGAPWFCSFFLVFVGTLVTVEAWAVLRDLL